MGRPTTVAAPPARMPRRTARRLSLKPLMFVLLSSLRQVDVIERRAGDDLDERVLQLEARALTGVLDGGDRRPLALGLHVAHRLLEELRDDAVHGPLIIVHELGEISAVGELAEVGHLAARIEREAVLVDRAVLA